MNRFTAAFVVFSWLLLPPAVAGTDLPAPNWTRAEAIAAQDSEAVRHTLSALYHLAREGHSESLLDEVRRIETDLGRPAPERDRLLQQLAAALGDFPPGHVGSEVLEHLAATRSLVRVPHEENARLGVPLYNIRAAATGSLAKWSQPGKPAVDVVTADTGALLAALAEPGPEHLRRIRQARAGFDGDELEAVVVAAPALPDASTASLVLAELAPAVIDRPAVVELLVGLLAHDHLGATAALALAGSDDAAVLDRLARVAESGDSPAARRAALGLESRLYAEPLK